MPDPPPTVSINFGELVPDGKVTLRAPETPEERAARLAKETADATFARWTRTGIIVVLVVGAVACTCVALASSASDKRQFAQAIVTTILGGLVGYALGKKDP